MPLHLDAGPRSHRLLAPPQVNGALDTDWSAHDGCH